MSSFWQKMCWLAATAFVVGFLLGVTGVFGASSACGATPGPINEIYGQQLCCCTAITGGMCCNSSPYPCGSLVPGCICS